MKRLRHYNKETAIVLSCFGSVVEQKRYEQLKSNITEKYPECDVKLAITSRMVINKLEQKGESYIHLPSVLASLDLEGYKRILVVSCYLFPTDEHKQLVQVVEGFRHFSLSRIEHTPAIIHHTHRANDLLSGLNNLFSSDSDLNLFIHHGAPYLDNAGHQAISYCDSLLGQLSDKNISCSLEGATPFNLVEKSIKSRIDALNKPNKPKLKLIPMLLVSGNHFVNDLKEISDKLSAICDVEIAADENGESFCLLSRQEVLDIISLQIDQGLTRLNY